MVFRRLESVAAGWLCRLLDLWTALSIPASAPLTVMICQLPGSAGHGACAGP